MNLLVPRISAWMIVGCPSAWSSTDTAQTNALRTAIGAMPSASFRVSLVLITSVQQANVACRHFAAMEKPDLLVEDVREFFTKYH